jgi:hypothetical protein
MVKATLRSALIAVLLTMALCVVASATPNWYYWWDETAPSVTYLWDDWASLEGSNPYTCLPDLVVPTSAGTGLAEITVGSPGAALIDGPADGYGTKTRFWDMGPGQPDEGPGGGMHVDVDSSAIGGMDIWVQVNYHVGITVAPTVSIAGATQVALNPSTFELRQVVENTGMPGDSEPQQWVTYISLWSLKPGAQFQGIDITADADMGATIDQVVVGTRVLPEPTAVVLATLGGIALLGRRRYRRG